MLNKKYNHLEVEKDKYTNLNITLKQTKREDDKNAR